MPPKLLQLIIYPSPLFAAHWALFLPNPTNPKTGQRIHADGSPATGFEVLFELDYDLRECTQSYQIIHLGQANEEDVERVAREIAAPVKSLVAVGAGLSGGMRRRRIEVKNCQTWVADVAERLAAYGVIEQEAFLTVANAPKN